jgi:hypothetical protein
MLPDTYFKRNGYIFGDRSRYIKPGEWSHEFIRFTNFKKALEWKREKEFGYKKELLSKSEAKLRGMKIDKKQ